ncbi:MAG: hypothetical protein IPK81_10950 [Rhodospirillales bacterium]|nr:MAG: hypothetical protein IPK81_10950 [Rhodospirillales bacterium]
MFTGPLVRGAPWPRIERFAHGAFAFEAGDDGRPTVTGDDRVLLHAPPAFDPAKPSAVVVFLHGFNALLSAAAEGHARPSLARTRAKEADGAGPFHVVDDHRVVEQVDASGFNGLLVAPQGHRDAAANDIPAFHDAAHVAAFLDEIAVKVAAARGGRNAGLEALRRAPLILAAYSGGWRPCADLLRAPVVRERTVGLILLDAPYSALHGYGDWFQARRDHAFAVCLHTASIVTPGGFADNLAAALDRSLPHGRATRRAPITAGADLEIEPGTAAVIRTRDGGHFAFARDGWPGGLGPLAEILRRVDPAKFQP